MAEVEDSVLSSMTSMAEPMSVVDSFSRIRPAERELGLDDIWEIPPPSKYYYCDDSASFILVFNFSVSADRCECSLRPLSTAPKLSSTPSSSFQDYITRDMIEVKMFRRDSNGDFTM